MCIPMFSKKPSGRGELWKRGQNVRGDLFVRIEFFFVAAKPLKFKCWEGLSTAFPHKTRGKIVLTMGEEWVS